jgi:hypothetical protein
VHHGDGWEEEEEEEEEVGVGVGVGDEKERDPKERLGRRMGSWTGRRRRWRWRKAGKSRKEEGRCWTKRKAKGPSGGRWWGRWHAKEAFVGKRSEPVVRRHLTVLLEPHLLLLLLLLFVHSSFFFSPDDLHHYLFLSFACSSPFYASSYTARLSLFLVATRRSFLFFI